MPEFLNKKENVWKRLTRLFRSGPVVRAKVASGENFHEPQGTARAYKKELSSLYVHSMASYGQYERLARYADYSEMQYCLHEDTKIAVPDGYKTIKQLADEYGLNDTFIVYAYDHNKKEIVPALGKQARKTRTDHSYKVTFDNGKEIIGTANHRLMLRDGSYRKIEDLRVGDSMMPFYRRSLRSPNGRHDSEHYQYVYTCKQWVAEHRLIASWVLNRELEKGEVVRHKNFKKYDNRIENLDVMTLEEHSRLHRNILNGKKWDRELNIDWINKFRKNHSEFMKLNNPNKRDDVSFGNILQAAEINNFNIYKTVDYLNISIPFAKKKIREKGFNNWIEFSKAYVPNWRHGGWDNKLDKNPRWDPSLDFQMICDAFTVGMGAKALSTKLGTTVSKINGRVRPYGYKNAYDFVKNYSNCKVVNIEYYGVIDLYDLTVDGYKNFATDSVISHNTAEIAAALDVYADETTAPDEEDNVITITSDNITIKNHLNRLFFDILNINFNAWSWVRNLCTNGDYILFVDASETNGILNLLPIPINEIEREEGYDKNDPMAFRYRWLTQGNKILENWQIIHFRLLGSENFLPYGSSVIEPARRIWRQLILIEDAMLVYRIVRSPERRVFYIDVGNVPPNEMDQFMQVIQTKLKRNQVIDGQTGRVDLRYNPLSVDEDYFIPVRDQRSSRIETLAGGQFTGDIDDVLYIQNKLFAALKVPKAYLNYEGELGSKATLAQQDARFAKTISRIQKIFISELCKIAMIHLFLLGYEGEDLADFTIRMPSSSTISIQQKLEIRRGQIEVAASIPEGMFSKLWVWKNIFKLSDQEIEDIKEQLIEDRLDQLRLEAVQLPPEATPGGGATAEEPTPGEENLPQTLGGETEQAPPEETPPEGAPPEGEQPLPEEGVHRRPTKGSTGNQAEISVTFGKDLFAPDEDAHEHAFGRKKQTASDPYDLRALSRLISRPFSELKKPESTMAKYYKHSRTVQNLMESFVKTDKSVKEASEDINKIRSMSCHQTIEPDDWDSDD